MFETKFHHLFIVNAKLAENHFQCELNRSPLLMHINLYLFVLISLVGSIQYTRPVVPLYRRYSASDYTQLFLMNNLVEVKDCKPPLIHTVKLIY